MSRLLEVHFIIDVNQKQVNKHIECTILFFIYKAILHILWIYVEDFLMEVILQALVILKAFIHRSTSVGDNY